MSERDPKEKSRLKTLIIALIVCLIGTGILLGTVYGNEAITKIVGEQVKQILSLIGMLMTLGGLFTFLFMAKKLADKHLS